MKKIFNLGSITLSGSGGVMGAESVLEALTEAEIESVSGAIEFGGYDEYFGQNHKCTNSTDCGSDSYNAFCTNTASNCDSATNSGKCPTK